MTSRGPRCANCSSNSVPTPPRPLRRGRPATLPSTCTCASTMRWLAGPGLVLPGPWSRLAARHHRRARARTSPRSSLRFAPDREDSSASAGCDEYPTSTRCSSITRTCAAPTGEDLAHSTQRWIGPCGPTSRTGGAWILTRRLRHCGLELRNASTQETFRARRGTAPARVAGEPGELLLYLFGRQGVAHVELDGPPSSLERVRTAKLGLCRRQRTRRHKAPGSRSARGGMTQVRSASTSTEARSVDGRDVGRGRRLPSLVLRVVSDFLVLG